MANLEYKLRDFFKKVDKSADEVKHKKAAGNKPKEEPATKDARVDEVSAASSSRDADMSSTSEARVAVKDPNASARVKPQPLVPNPAPLKPTEPVKKAEGKLVLTTEGTGEPRPMSTSSEVRKMPKVRSLDELLDDVETEAPKAKMATAQVEDVKSAAPGPVSVEATTAQENWSRLPRHLQILFSTPEGEVAQRSYKTFKDSRSQLVERLLDPPLTLEDTARILNVCPTTVRRYTNSKKLKHYRTAGNQRRFRLSEVLEFMETNPKSANSASGKKKNRGEQ